MPAIRKNLNDITPGDVLELCQQQWPEDEQLEFKEDLPSKKGRKQDSWYSDPRAVGEHARNKILEEVIALANNHGGDVVIGVAESEDKPARATALSPIPQCTDLAERPYAGKTRDGYRLRGC
jgi:hypothetical protein